MLLVSLTDGKVFVRGGFPIGSKQSKKDSPGGWKLMSVIRENRRARERHARDVACLLLARPFFLVPTSSKGLQRRLCGKLVRKGKKEAGSHLHKAPFLSLHSLVQHKLSSGTIPPGSHSSPFSTL